MNIHKIGQYLNVELGDGTSLTCNDCTDEFFAKVIAAKDNREALLDLFYPENQATRTLLKKLEHSNILTQEGNSIYIKSICELTVPQDFAAKILEAEELGDKDKLSAYLNFWTLLSLNPDSRVRNNLFWFLNRWGMVISKSGLIVAYRNADIKTEGTRFNQGLTKFVTQEYARRKYIKSGSLEDIWVIMQDNTFEILSESALDNIPDDVVILGKLNDLYSTLTTDNSENTTVYTDHHSHKFSIRLGHIVTMPRGECDENQHNTCSRGLHVAAKGWLQRNYFGQVGMRVLVNPSNIVAVP